MDRPTGTTDDPAGLLARYPAIVVALQSGLSLRKAAAAAGVRSTRLDGVQAAITATDAQDTDLTALHFRDTAPHCKIQER